MDRFVCVFVSGLRTGGGATYLCDTNRRGIDNETVRQGYRGRVREMGR